MKKFLIFLILLATISPLLIQFSRGFIQAPVNELNKSVADMKARSKVLEDSVEALSKETEKSRHLNDSLDKGMEAITNDVDELKDKAQEGLSK